MNDESVGDLIDYLLKREFGSLAPPPAPALGNRSGARNNDSGLMRYGKIEARRAEYQAMSIDVIRNLSSDARKADAEARAARLKEEEPKLFFNRPNASADLAYYAKMATWTLEEAIALSLGKAPGVVNPDSMEGERLMPEAWWHSPFRRGYVRRRELVRRAHKAHELDEPTRPAVFLSWAKSMDMGVPPELEPEVAKRAPVADVRKELEAARARIAELECEIARDKGSHRWPWGTYETEHLRKLAAAAQRFWTNYDPADPSTASTNEVIAAWLRNEGVPSDRLANAIATILRVDGLATGPR